VRPSVKIVAPIAVLATSLAIAGVLITSDRGTESARPTPPAPMVRVVRARPATVALPVTAHGTVEPRTESDLVTEVSGRIVSVSPQLAAGGFFEEGDVLATIDPRDYEIALEGARAALARAESNLAHEIAALERQRSMGRSGASSRQRLDDAIHAATSAEAGVREAKVAVRRAELDLERSRIRAPFAGRVRTKHVDVGQFMNRGAPVARVFAIDYAEVRLPISDSDLVHLEIPAASRPIGDELPDEAELRGPRVTLTADFAGARRTWSGRLVRTEGALDPRTRMLTVVVRVDDPYGRTGDGSAPPLPVGLFVEASIEGREVDAIYTLPRAALRRDNEVLVVDDDDTLHVRAVEILRSGREQTWVSAGLEPGDRVIVSALEVAMDGMKVRTTETPEGDASARWFSPDERDATRPAPAGAPS